MRLGKTTIFLLAISFCLLIISLNSYGVSSQEFSDTLMLSGIYCAILFTTKTLLQTVFSTLSTISAPFSKMKRFIQLRNATDLTISIAIFLGQALITSTLFFQFPKSMSLVTTHTFTLAVVTPLFPMVISILLMDKLGFAAVEQGKKSWFTYKS